MACNVCSIKFRSKHSSISVLCLLRNLLEQSLASGCVPHKMTTFLSQKKGYGFN